MKDFPWKDFFIILLASILACYLNMVNEGKFLRKFLDDQAMPIMASMLAITFAVISAVLSLITIIAKNTGAKFDRTSAEMSSSVKFLLIIFALYFTISIFAPEGKTILDNHMKIIILATDIMRTTIFVLFIYHLKDFINALLGVRDA